jgi:hypothetical protein
MLGDLAGLPFLMKAPCPHFEQISARGSDSAAAAPICPQLGQMIRVSMNTTSAAAGAAARASRARQQIPPLWDVHGDARRSWITASEHRDMAFAGSTFSAFAPTVACQ